jgi:hypothetical protein
VAERNSLLNCRTGNGTEGSNPSLSAENIFLNIFDSHCRNTIFADLQTTGYLTTMFYEKFGM